MTDPLVVTAASGLSDLTQYGLAGVLLMLLLIGGVFIIRYFMNEFKACKEENSKFAQQLIDQSSKVIDKNTEAFHGVTLALTELKAKIEK